MSSKSLAHRLGFKTRAEKDAMYRAAADNLIARIRASNQTVVVFGRTCRCIDKGNIPPVAYDFLGSGLTA